MAYRGIDVSRWQGMIDWRRVKQSGVQFAILRCSAGRNRDSQFERNYRGAGAVGLPVGIYHYSYARNVREARREAALVVKLAAGKRFGFPVYFDIEDSIHKKLSKSACTEIAKAFCEVLEKAGFWAGIYSYDSFFGWKLHTGVQSRYAVWCARIGSRPKLCRIYQMHQHSWKGKVPGISGDVDLNESTVWYPALMQKAGRNGYGKR